MEIIHQQLSIQNCYYIIQIVRYLGTDSKTAIFCMRKRESRKVISAVFHFHELAAVFTTIDMKEKSTFVFTLDKQESHHGSHVEVDFTIHTEPENYLVTGMVRPLRERSLSGLVTAANLAKTFFSFCHEPCT